MSLTVRVLIGLVAGLVVGFVVNAAPELRGVVPWIEPLGSIFINAIRMTVVPLVVALFFLPGDRSRGRVEAGFRRTAGTAAKSRWRTE